MSYQLYNPAPVYFDLLGLQPIAGGSITFYDKGTTTLKDTWSDEDLTILNPNPVDLDAGGRVDTQVWLDGDYSIVIRDADEQTIAARDITSGQSAGASIPALDDGFLTNDGTNLFWQVIREVPDPTGFTNRILSTDGSNLLWIEQAETPDIPDPEIVIQTTPGFSFQAGVSDSTTKFFMQAGNSTAQATGGRDTNNSVTFPVPFAAAPFVVIQPTSVSNSGGPMVPETTSTSATGFTTNFTIAAGDGANAKINNPVPYSWIAFGTRTVAGS